MAIAATPTDRDHLAPTIASLLASWARSLRAAGKSPNTVSGYLDGLRCFTEFLRELGLDALQVLRERLGGDS